VRNLRSLRRSRRATADAAAHGSQGDGPESDHKFQVPAHQEDLFWAGAGGGLALVAHPFDDDVNRALVGNDTAENVFKAGAILGQLSTLLGSASVVYAVGRLKDQPKVSHLGMDLIEALAMSEAITQTLKYCSSHRTAES
jgi:hypothetical protein